MNKKLISTSKCRILVTLCFLGLIALTGCQSKEKIFPPPAVPITWPLGSDTPRFRFVGQLTKAEDLKPAKSWLSAFGDYIFGGTPEQPLYGPRDILVHNDNVIWVADPGGRCLHRFQLDNRSYMKITQMSIDNGITEFNSPVGLCKGPDTSIFVCDSVNAEVYQFNDDGVFIKRLNLTDDVSRPTAISWNSEKGLLYILDTVNHNIKVYTLDDQLQAVIGKRGGMPGEFNFPIGIEYSSRSLWVVDAGNGRIQQLDINGKHLKTIGRFGKSPGDFALPKSIAIDSDSNLYVTDARFENIQLFNSEGQLLMHMGNEGADAGGFSLPSGIFISETDRLWVCDSYNNRLQVFQRIKKDTDYDKK